MSLTSSENWEKNCQLEQDDDQFVYSAMDGQYCNNKQHGDTVPENARDTFLCYLHINDLKARHMWFRNVGYVCSTQNRGIFNPVVYYFPDSKFWIFFLSNIHVTSVRKF